MELFNKALFLSQQNIFALTHGRVYTLMVNLFQILNQFVLLFRKNVVEKSSIIWGVLPLVKINTHISETPCIYSINTEDCEEFYKFQLELSVNLAKIRHFQTLICREIQIAEIWFYYLVLHHCKNRHFLKPFTAHTSDLLELTSLSNKFDGHNQGKPENFPHFCSAAKPTIFRPHISDLHRFCSNRVFRRTKTQSVGPLSFTVQFPMATVKKKSTV
jgi:hypothetical protein